MHASVAAALRGQQFWHVGQGGLTAAATRLGGRLPWPLLRRIYARIGAAEGIPPGRVGDVDLEGVAAWLTAQLPSRTYPAVMIGSSNGALTQLAAAMQVPWLPGTVLLPVARRHDPHDVDAALEFGRRVAPPLLARNRTVVLHHMHDQVQDELMAAEMAYFRLKWQRLPEAYRTFLDAALAPGAPVILVEDSSHWPVVRVDDRHVFQPGAQGGLDPEGYLGRPRTPTPDDTAPEAEWGAEPDLTDDIAAWCAAHQHPLIRIRYHGPQAPSAPVADTFRSWYRRRDENHRRLVVPCFILADPWQTIASASVPFWTFFSVQPALDSLRQHLESLAEPYDEAHLILFQHGADSEGIARPDQWAQLLREHGTTADFLGLDPRRFPHDIAFLTRYGPAMSRLPKAQHPWTPLALTDALDSIDTHPDIDVERSGD